MVGNILGLSVCSALAYNLGGQGKKGNFLDFLRNKLTRRLGCALIQFIAIFFVLKISAPFWVHFLNIGITYGALTSYWDFTGQDNHYLHAFGIALGLILYAYVGAISWLAFGVRSITMILAMGLWSKYWKVDFIEELFRGSIIILTLFIFI